MISTRISTSLTPKLRENLAAFEERARNNERVMRLVRDVPLDFTLDDLTLGGWNRQEVNGFFERYEMNSMRTRMGKLMQDGLLGEGVRPRTPGKHPSRRSPRARGGLAPESSLDVVLRDAEAPLVAFNDERVAVFNATSSGLAVVSTSRSSSPGLGDVAFAGHDVQGPLSTRRRNRRHLARPRRRHLDHGVPSRLDQWSLRTRRRGVDDSSANRSRTRGPRCSASPATTR